MHSTPIKKSADLQSKKTYLPLPEKLKSALEYLSGICMAKIRVHYNSTFPEHFHAKAITFGEDIYLSKQAESLLAHEAWHVIQQKQGRVKADGLLNGYFINTCQYLEEEADEMGALANQLSKSHSLQKTNIVSEKNISLPIIQRAISINANNNSITQARNTLSVTHNITSTNLIYLNSILGDINSAPQAYRTFATWNAFILELKIRNFGYMHFDQMQRMIGTNLSWVASLIYSRRTSRTYTNNEYRLWMGGGNFPTEANCWETVIMASTRVQHAGAQVVPNNYRNLMIRDSRLQPRLTRYLIANNNDCRASREIHIAQTRDDAQTRNVLIPAVNITNLYIPCGRLVLMGGSAHVALSTGRTRRNSIAGARNHFGTYGHEIIEINFDTPLGRAPHTAGVDYSTIEDRLVNPNTKTSLTCGIMPGLNFANFF